MKNSASLITVLVLAGLSVTALDIERHGITWTINGSPVSGTYANGDPWVVGPVEITAISPSPSSGRNGTEVNPAWGLPQGFDDRSSNYSDAENDGLNLPLTVPADSSVVSGISLPDAHSYDVIQMESFSILTVVATAPAAESFRPSYLGDASRASLWTTNDIDWSALNTLDAAVLDSVPAIPTVSAKFERAWYEKDPGSWGRSLHTPYMSRYDQAETAADGYGKDMSITTGAACLLLNLDYQNEEKFELLIRMVQLGIDYHGIIQQGGFWTSAAGHQNGRLAPTVVAAMVLGDANIQNSIQASNGKFSEYAQTFYVTQTEVDQVPYTADGRPRDPYTQECMGKPDWGSQHEVSPHRDGNNWDAYYRDIGGGVMQAPAVLAQVMGAKDIMGADDAFFAYARRHIYYFENRFTDPQYYNGYDDGTAWGEIAGHTPPPVGPWTGNTNPEPFAGNPTTDFARSFYLTYENAAAPDGSGGGSPPPDVGANVRAVPHRAGWRRR